MNRSLRILVVDDHPIMRTGLRHTLAFAGDVGEVGEAADAPEALALVRGQDWDAVMLDIGLPGRGGLELLKDIKVERPNLPVLILSGHSEDQFGLRSIRAGAAGYLTKGGAPENVVCAIRRVAAGGRYISANLAERLATEISSGNSAPNHGSLSDREFDVMRLLASAKTVGEIATQLSLSVKTVSTYRARILEKLQLRNNAEMMQYAITNGLLDR